VADTPTVPYTGTTSGQRRVVAIGEILLCSSVPTQIALSVLLGLIGLTPEGDDGRLSLPFVLILSLGDTLILVALMAALTRAHGDSLRAIWLGDRPVARETLVGAMLIAAEVNDPIGYVLAFIAVAFATMNVVGGYVVTDRMLQMFRKKPAAPKPAEADAEA